MLFWVVGVSGVGGVEGGWVCVTHAGLGKKVGEHTAWRAELPDSEELFCALLESVIYDRHHDTCIKTCIKHAKDDIKQFIVYFRIRSSVFKHFSIVSHPNDLHV